jgi:putative ABC transport system permease protein
MQAKLKFRMLSKAWTLARFLRFAGAGCRLAEGTAWQTAIVNFAIEWAGISMKLRKSLKIAVNMVTHSKLRSWLTIIGIVIGVASVIAIVSLGEAMQAQVNSQLSSLNANLVTISPGYSRAQGTGFGRFEPGGPGGGGTTSSSSVLTDDDVKTLEGISSISAINAQISGRANVSFGSESGMLQITGTDPDTWAKVTSSKVDQGRTLQGTDKNVIVIGYSLADSYFKKEITLGKELRIAGKSFKVIGITEDTGRFDRSVYMPLDIAYDVLNTSVRDEYNTVLVMVKDGSDIDAVETEITSALMVSRRVDTQDFSLSATKDMVQSISSATSSITLFLAGIAAVSLLVGAVGIANTMFTSVLEKTKEIGIMKAIGARNSDIMAIFLFNSALIGLVGGLLGAILGTIASSITSSLLTGSGLQMPFMRGGGGGTLVDTINFGVIFGVLLISVLIGVISGAIPAYQASRLKPVDALRYE